MSSQFSEYDKPLLISKYFEFIQEQAEGYNTDRETIKEVIEKTTHKMNENENNQRRQANALEEIAGALTGDGIIIRH